MLEVRQGLPEGMGVFTTREVQQGTVLCNYGGILLSKRAGMEMHSGNEFGNYLMEFIFKQKRYFCLHSKHTIDTYGKLINHSKLHPNCTPKVFQRRGGVPEVMFLALEHINAGEQLVYDYGKIYDGVEKCISNCFKCKAV
jgi:SET domain-containing protein